MTDELISSDPETIHTAGQAGHALPPRLPIDEGLELWAPDFLSGAIAPASGAQRQPDRPVPIIGTVDLAGIVMQGYSVSIPAGGSLVVGEHGESRPSVLEMFLIASAAGLSIQSDAAGSSAIPGFPIPSTRELRLHARRVSVYNSTAGALDLAVMVVRLDAA